MKRRINRRTFLHQTGTLGAGVWIASRTGSAQETSPNGMINIASIGVGGQGGGNLRRIVDQKLANIVALCDIDAKKLDEVSKLHPAAKKYSDFREMLEKEKSIDGVVVSTADHCHAVASVMAMKLGKHVYCEKPLTHSVHEARVMAETAAAQKVVTQMGQSYSGDLLFSQVEAIGAVKEIHCWSNRPIWPQGIDRPTDTPPVPEHIKWDLWLGPAPERPYHPAYHPFKWRGFWDFGTGALGDMACHIMDASFRGLKLGLPSTIETEGEPRHPETAPKWCIVRYEFAREGAAPLKLTWYDGGKKPPEELAQGQKMGDGGYIMIGEKGTLFHGKVLLPAEKFADFKPASVEPKYPGRHRDWLEAIKAKGPTGSPFAYGANMTEAILLGNVAFRVGKKIEWDAGAMKAKNCPEADQYLRREYRKGWTL